MGHDQLSKALVTTSHLHSRVHRGLAYLATTVDTSMNLNDTLVLAFKTPTPTTSLVPHLALFYSAKAAGHIDILEGPTWTAGTGSQNPIINRNRNLQVSSSLLEDTSGSFLATGNMILNPTITDAGTAIRTLYEFAAKHSGTGTLGTLDQEEIVLDYGNTYAIRFTADLGSNAAWMQLIWYEAAYVVTLD